MPLVPVGGTAVAYKLNKRDVEKIERQTGKPADDLTEEEFAAKKGRKFAAFVIPTAGMEG